MAEKDSFLPKKLLHMASNVPWVFDFIHASHKSGDLSVWESVYSKEISNFLVLSAKMTKNEK